MTTERIAVCLKSFDGSICSCLRSGVVHSVCAKPDLPRFRAGYTKGRTSNSRQQQTIFLQQIHELCSKRSLESRESRDDVYGFPTGCWTFSSLATPNGLIFIFPKSTVVPSSYTSKCHCQEFPPTVRNCYLPNVGCGNHVDHVGTVWEPRRNHVCWPTILIDTCNVRGGNNGRRKRVWRWFLTRPKIYQSTDPRPGVSPESLVAKGPDESKVEQWAKSHDMSI